MPFTHDNFDVESQRKPAALFPSDLVLPLYTNGKVGKCPHLICIRGWVSFLLRETPQTSHHMQVACVKTFLSQSDSFVTAGDAMAAAFINGEIIQSAERVIPASAATLVSPSSKAD